MLNIHNLNVEETFLTEFVIRELSIENVPFLKNEIYYNQKNYIRKIFIYMIANRKEQKIKKGRTNGWTEGGRKEGRKNEGRKKGRKEIHNSNS